LIIEKNRLIIHFISLSRHRKKQFLYENVTGWKTGSAMIILKKCGSRPIINIDSKTQSGEDVKGFVVHLVENEIVL